MDDKNSPTSSATEATAPSAGAQNAGDGGAVAGGLRRFSAKRKLAAVQRLMRGESLDAVSRDGTPTGDRADIGPTRKTRRRDGTK